MTGEPGEGITAEQGFEAMVGFLREYGTFMADSRGVSALLEAVDPPASASAPSPPANIWSGWLEAIGLALQEPELDRYRETSNGGIRNAAESLAGDNSGVRLTALQGFDATIRFLEHLSAEFPAAEYFLMEVWYSEVFPSGELNTADGAAWYDFLSHVEDVRERQRERS